MKKLFLIIIFLYSFSTLAIANCDTCHGFDKQQNIIEQAKKYNYVREKTNNNDAPEINAWLKNCGLGPGYSYCQAFVANMEKEMYEQNGLGKSPFPMKAGVAVFAQYCIKHPFEFEVIPTKKILWDINRPKKGDIASWMHGKAQYTSFGYMGHAGLVQFVDENKKIKTIEANTKAGPGGDQSGTVKGDMKYGHEGVYERIRTIDIYSNFPILYFIREREKK